MIDTLVMPACALGLAMRGISMLRRESFLTRVVDDGVGTLVSLNVRVSWPFEVTAYRVVRDGAMRVSCLFAAS